MLPKINPTNTSSWERLNERIDEVLDHSILDYFQDENRVEEYSMTLKNLYLDFSKNLVDNDTMALLYDLAQDCQLDDAKKAFFTGEHINETENRSVLHPALRMPRGEKLIGDGEDVNQEVWQVLDRMAAFVNDLTDGDWRASSVRKYPMS